MAYRDRLLSPAFVAAALFLLGIACALGCSRTGLDEDLGGAARVDGGVVVDGSVADGSVIVQDGAPTVDGKPSTTCSATTCPTGCCDLNGVCQLGSGLLACGTQGAACQNCESEGHQLCTLGACGDKVASCSAANCPGCCSGQQCLTGASAAACGQGGAQCADCPAGDVCTASGAGGICEPQKVAGCGPQTCPGGCCDDNGVCQAGASINTCGSGGETCQDCQANGFDLCNASPHVCALQVGPTCDPFGCPGCCMGNSCLAGTDPTACGVGGTCTDCVTLGETCMGGFGPRAGTCQPPPVACTAASCPTGCCDAQGRCVGGNSDRACGGGGGQCTNCVRAGESCQNQACAAPVCDANSCPDGCCDMNANCRSGFGNGACGTGGSACVNCRSSGNQCFNQVCASPTSCAATCDTCCDAAGNCQPGTSTTVCGSFGATCTDCSTSPGQICISGTCAPPSNCSQLCDGCCDGSGNCLDGTSATQCGGFGFDCQNCTSLTPAMGCDSQAFPPQCGGPAPPPVVDAGVDTGIVEAGGGG